MTDFESEYTDTPDLGEGDHPVIPWLNQARRAWIYRVVAALGTVAVITGAVTSEVVFGVVAVIAALLSTGLAAVNTSTQSGYH